MKYPLLLSSLGLFLILNIPISESYKGLFITTIGTRSHINFYAGIMDTLAQDGHQITFATPHNSNFKIENVTKIQLIENLNDALMGNPFDMDKGYFSNFIKYVPEACVKAYKDPGVQKAMKEKFDYIILPIFFSECFLSYTYKHKIPHIYVTPNGIASPYSERIGALELSSITPSKMLAYTFPFSFLQRVHITLSTIPLVILQEYITRRTGNLAIEHNIWDVDTPPISELLKEPTIVLINSIRALEHPPKSTPPNVIYAGGIHIKSPKTLPKDLSEWIDGSGNHGFIFFSLGTGVKAEHMKKEYLDILIEVFRSLKQRVIWKFDGSIDNLPSNVMIKSWLPQQDILGHPKIRLFITHGGMFSCLEATYFEVPVLGMPVFLDQKMNVAEIVSEGWGRKVDWDSLTTDRLKDVIAEVLTNNSLRERIHHRALLMRDWPRHPKEEVTYWVNYAIRHHGAKHLQSPLAFMPWYQVYNVDVWLFIITSVIAILIIIVNVLKFGLKLCSRKLFKVKKE